MYATSALCNFGQKRVWADGEKGRDEEVKHFQVLWGHQREKSDISLCRSGKQQATALLYKWTFLGCSGDFIVKIQISSSSFKLELLENVNAELFYPQKRSYRIFQHPIHQQDPSTTLSCTWDTATKNIYSPNLTQILRHNKLRNYPLITTKITAGTLVILFFRFLLCH